MGAMIDDVEKDIRKPIVVGLTNIIPITDRPIDLFPFEKFPSPFELLLIDRSHIPRTMELPDLVGGLFAFHAGKP